MGLQKKAAVFTIVQNEPLFLRLWLRHYAGHFATKDIYVLDHDSNKPPFLEYLNSLRLGTEVNVVPVHWVQSFCHSWLLHTVQIFQAFLLQSYQCVLFAEADEVVTPFPGAGMLEEYVDRFLREGPPWVRCAGFEVLHAPDEPSLDWDKPVLRQRRQWSPSKLYSKPLLAKQALHWEHGFHDLIGQHHEQEWGQRLALLHLHRVDFDYARQKHQEQAEREWSPEDRAAGRGFQNRLTDPRQFEQWFYRPETMGLEALSPQVIPEEWRGAV
jgi:hypothetical protein